jgi:hypothetical protein
MARMKRNLQNRPVRRGRGVSLHETSVKSDEPFYTGSSNVEIIEPNIFVKIAYYMIWTLTIAGVAAIIFFVVRMFEF